MSRIVVWFSAGAASSVAALLTLINNPEGWPTNPKVVLAYANPGSEHPDNERFITDVEKWLHVDVVRLRSEKYQDTWQVWEERRFLNSPAGALCTAELKRKVRHAFQQPDDIQVFGYTVEERARAQRFRDNNPEVELSTPLIDAGLTKSDCLAIIDRAGIELPAMYRLGYRNNNCIGCVKGGMGYWNKIRRDFPATFDRMALLEREIGASCIRDVFLDELDPERGSHADEPSFECSLMCELVSP